MDPSEKIFVTGGTGFIGTWLIERLIERGHPVRALSRRDNPEAPPGWEGSNGGPLRHEQVEIVRGDVTDAESIVRGMEGCSYVFHLAGYARNWARRVETFDEINVEGVRHVLDAAKKHGVKRTVCTSTLLTLSSPGTGVVGNEETPRPTKFLTDYQRTKTLGEELMLQRAAEGEPVVVVNPTYVFGPGHLTEANTVTRLINDYDRGRMPILPNRGKNYGSYVLVHDVVNGHLKAMERGRIGERYLLGGTNVTLKQFFRTIGEVTGRPRFQVPVIWISPMVFAYFMKARADLLGMYPTVTPGWVRTYFRDRSFSSEKAEAELGYTVTPLAEAIRTTYEWLLRVRKKR